MSEDSIRDRAVKVIAEHLSLAKDQITDEASFVEDMGADSLDTVELVMALEEEFGVEIPDAVAEKILTVGDAIRHLEEQHQGS